jgi:hypothetical protein
MKTLQLKTLPFLLVELPDNIKSIDDEPLINSFGCNIRVWDNTGHDLLIEVDGAPTYIGKLTELTEGWFQEQVEDTDFFQPHAPYSDNIERESFYSYLQSKEKVYLGENPIIKPKRIPDTISDHISKVRELENFYKAESRTFDPERTYIFQIKTD